MKSKNRRSGSQEGGDTRPFADPPPSGKAATTEKRDPRSVIGSKTREWCYRCGAVWPKNAMSCPGCGGLDRTSGRTRPQIAPKQFHERFDYPWDLIPWPQGGAACIFGGPGSGKSTLSSILRPRLWMTKEQDHAPVGEMFRRTTPGFMPQVAVVETAADVERELAVTERGPVVIDSLTSLGPQDALLASHLMVAWTRESNERSLSIIQVNKEGDAAGYREITHLFDAVIQITPEEWGLRIFNVDKSRWCALHSRYWIFDGTGQVSRPEFPAAYSVEGRPGNYYLHPFPLRGGTWTGLLGFLAVLESLPQGVASSACVARYMRTGFIEPYDVAERRRFAEEHGLQWLDPTELFPDGPPKTEDDEDEDDREEAPRKRKKKTPGASRVIANLWREKDAGGSHEEEDRGTARAAEAVPTPDPSERERPEPEPADAPPPEEA